MAQSPRYIQAPGDAFSGQSRTAFLGGLEVAQTLCLARHFVAMIRKKFSGRERGTPRTLRKVKDWSLEAHSERERRREYLSRRLAAHQHGPRREARPLQHRA